MHSGDWQVFDAHCDTLGRLYSGMHPQDAALQFSLPAVEKFGKYVQTMAFCICGERTKTPFSSALRGIEILQQTCRGKTPLICRAEELQNHTAGTGMLLAIEGGEAIEGSMDKLRALFEKGVRLMTLTWNNTNEISDTAASPANPGGLTTFGREVVAEMEKLGMAVDVSHISEKGFWDVLETAKKPVIASHSCAAALCPHHRNLTDAQFVALCKNGGVAGVNFYPLFLGGNTVDDIVRHILHFLALGGENHIGFGSDFDGIQNLPEEICGAADFDKIINALLRGNISEEIVRKIAYTNMESYFLQILPAAQKCLPF